MQSHFAPGDARRAYDGIGWVEALEGALCIVVAFACQTAHFMKAARICQRRNAFACVLPTTGLEFGQCLGAAHGQRTGPPRLQLRQFSRPFAGCAEWWIPILSHFAAFRPKLAASSWAAIHSSAR